MTLETGREAGFGEFPSPDRLTVGTSNRLRVTPRYCGKTNPLDGGDRYGDVACDTDVHEMRWRSGELTGETGVLAECCIPRSLGGGWWAEGGGIGPLFSGSKVRDHPTAHCSPSGEVVASADPPMDKATLPRGYAGRNSHTLSYAQFLALLLIGPVALTVYWIPYSLELNRGSQVPFHAAETEARCRALNTKPGPPSDFYARTASDRFVEGTKHVWIRNATIWTGRVQGLEVIQGDLLLMNGIIKAVGRVDLQSMGLNDHDEVETLDARGAYVTPGYVCCRRLLFVPS